MNKQEFALAQQKLDTLLLDSPDLTETDRAYSFHTQALLFQYQQQYSSAQIFFEKSIEVKDLLSKTTRIQTLAILANLAIYNEKYQKAINFSLDYLLIAGLPEKSIYLTLASAYYQVGQYKDAVSPLLHLIDKYESDRATYSTLFSVYYELNQLPKATGILEKMVKIWPKTSEYWLQLASTYLEQDLIDQSLEVMQLAYTQKFIIRGDELLQYAYTLTEKNLPHKAALILQQALDESSIQPTYKTYELLAHFYLEAKEYELALRYLLKASELAESGKEDLFIAQLHYNRENYTETIDHARGALKKGITLPGNAYMLLAAAYQEMEDQEATKTNLKLALKYKETQESANAWLKSLRALKLQVD